MGIRRHRSCQPSGVGELHRFQIWNYNSNMPNVIERLREQARSNPRRIVFPETHDPRVIEAAHRFADQGLGFPVLVQRDDGLSATIIGDLEMVEPNETLKDQCANQLYENRKHKGLSVAAARLAIADPLLFSALLVKTGFVAGSVAGSLATTASVIRAGLYGIGPIPGGKMVSSFFLMQFPQRAITYSDCGVVPDPDAQQLAEIAITAAHSHHVLTSETPYVAMLSFSTLGSADHSRVQKVRDALAIIRRQRPDIHVDGELQFDAALVPEVAERKAPKSEVAGRANVFIFPDLDSGNIAYKITERLGGAKALGPLIQGLAHPFMDLSRGCSVDDIVDVAVIASVLSSG
jgi:phosphate acetyltransferase